MRITNFLIKEDLADNGLPEEFVILILIFIILCVYAYESYDTKKRNKLKNQEQFWNEVQIAGRKNRAETKCLQTRIVDMLKKTFDTVKIVENVAMKYGDTECVIPMIGITPKGILLFQFLDQPGKAVFGKMTANTWRLAQSDKCEQEIPNAMFTAFELAIAVKQETDIDVKPIVVISKYTIAESILFRNSFRFNIVTEDNVLHELEYMKKYGATKQLTDDFMDEVKNRLEALDSDFRS